MSEEKAAVVGTKRAEAYIVFTRWKIDEKNIREATLITKTKAKQRLQPGDYVYGVAQAVFDEEGKLLKLNKQFVADAVLVDMLKKGLVFENVQLNKDKDALAMKSGALSRLDKCKFVVLSRIIDQYDNIIGHTILDSNGNYKRMMTKQIVQLAEKVLAEKGIPYMNAIYVPTTQERAAHIKAYPECEFPLELYIRKAKNKFADVAEKVPAKEEEPVKAETLKLKGVQFNEKQLEEIRKGMDSGIDVRIYMDPAISAEKMQLLRLNMESGFDVRPFTNPKYLYKVSKDSLGLVLAYQQVFFSMDVLQELLNPDYTVDQLAELQSAIIKGIDISSFANPELSPAEMAEARRKAQGVWVDYTDVFEEFK